jgi:hypothetical protein
MPHPAFTSDSLWPHPRTIELQGEMPAPRTVRLEPAPGTPGPRPERAQDFARIAGATLSTGPGAYPLRLSVESMPGSAPESYELSLGPEGADVVASDAAALEHGVETLLQIAALSRHSGRWPCLRIRDWPRYRKRGFMVDLGRSVFPLPMLERIVRILARLKMNQLHLHLHDDELCGLRYPGLPFGEENPFALSVEELGRLVRYAEGYHVEIVPELEAWGHVGSLVYHRPELRGGEGMYAGSSFLISEGAFDLMRDLLDHVVEALPRKATVHLGLDEAKWFADPALGPGFRPEDMVGRYYDLLQSVGARHGRDLTLRLWADHSGRPVPERARHNTIIEPWQYWVSQAEAMDRAVEKYSGAGKMRWMMGAGQSGHEFRGAWHATRYWCRSAVDSPNCDGVNVTFWCSNDLARNLVTLFSGAFWAWNPLAVTSFAAVEDYEMHDRAVIPIMRTWQLLFPDAWPDAMLRDQGPEVSYGYRLWGERHGEPVAPTVPIARTAEGLAYLSPRP